MKTIVIVLVGLLSAANARIVVTDPISDVLGQEQHLEDIAKAVEMIGNQVTQIDTLTQQSYSAG